MGRANLQGIDESAKVARHIVVMGVSGVGKSAVAARLAAELGYSFGEGDDFHPGANVEKMASAIPLTDADRAPWLDALADWLRAAHAAGRSTVLACSALKRRYRDRLRAAAPNVEFVHLTATADALRERMKTRAHFMPQDLLPSQIQALEPLSADENGIEVDAAPPLEHVVAVVLEHLSRPAANANRGEGSDSRPRRTPP